MSDPGRQVMGAVARRFAWFFFLEVFLNTLDRANVSFAALQMNAELGFDPKIYGYGVSLFFLTYMICQVPAASLLDRFGTRRVLAGMMILWGLVASLMCVVQTKEQFYALRLALGVAEAGAPAALGLYIARWVPPRSIAGFMVWPNLAFPFGVVLGAPLSGALLTLFDGHAGWAGWRWMFLLEGLPTVLLGLFALVWLSDDPLKVRWLTPEQKDWLAAQTPPPRRAAGAGLDIRSLGAVLRDRRLWLFSAVSFTIGASVYGLIFWLPQVLAGLSPGSGPIRAVLLSAVPWMGVAVGLLLTSWNSDRVGERHLHLAVGGLVGAAGLACSAALGSPGAGLAALTLAGLGVGITYAVMWPIVIAYLGGRPTAAVSMGFFNLLANLAGLAVNSGIGWLRVTTGAFSAPLYVLAGLLLIGALLIWLDGRRHGRRIPAVSS